MNILLISGVCVGIGFLALGIRIVTPMERGLIERLGKYKKYANRGFNWIIPIIDKMRTVDIREMMVNAQPQQIITKDKLNATVDAQVYFKIKDDEASVMASQYNIYDYETQIVNLARTTLRNIIGSMTLNEANSDRDKINKSLMETLIKETGKWGIEVVRTELKEIDPPQDVQETMNRVVKAENEKQAAVDFATAAETQADGKRRAAVKEAEGLKQAQILKAEGEGQAIKIVNEAANKFFTGNAVMLRKIEMAEKTMANNSKIVIPMEKGQSLVNVIGNIADIK